MEVFQRVQLFINFSFNNRTIYLKDFISYLKTEKVLYVFGRKGQGKTSIAYKIMKYKRILKKKFRLNCCYYFKYETHISETLAPAKLYKAMNEVICNDIKIENTLNFDNSLFIIDDVMEDSSLQTLLKLLNHDDFFKKTKFIVFLPLDLQDKINTDNKFVIDRYTNKSVEQLSRQNGIKHFNGSFFQIYWDSKSLKKLFEKYNEHSEYKKFFSKEYTGIFIEYYQDKITLEELDKRLHYELYLSENQRDIFISFHISELIGGTINDKKVDEIFSKKPLSETILKYLEFNKNLINIKRHIRKRLDILLEGSFLSIFCKSSELDVLHRFYAYWSILNIKEDENQNEVASKTYVGDYFNFNKEQTDEDNAKEIERRVNLIKLIKVYKSIYFDSSLRFFYQDFSQLKEYGIESVLHNMDFSNAIIAGCKFSELYLKNVNFSNAKLINTNLTPLESEDINLKGLKITDSTLSGIDMNQIILENIVFEKTNRLINLDLSEIDFTEVSSLVNMDFSNSDLTDCTFYKQDLSEANFSNCRLLNVDFYNVDLTNTIFTNADLSYANFTETEVITNDFFNPDKDEFYELKSIHGIKGLDNHAIEQWNLHHKKEDK